jgi:Protein of unknown function (DUF1566)
MQAIQKFKCLRCISARSMYLVAAVSISLVLTACGGSEALVPEAVVTAVDPAQILEGSGQMVFTVHLDKPVQRALAITFSTSSTGKAGVPSTGSATGGVACTGTVDFINASSKVVSIPVGSTTSSLNVVICPDTDFEPNETFNLTWTSPGASGKTVLGTIINDDAGGLNSTGAPTVMGSRAAFGRDGANLLPAGTPMGFSFDTSDSTNGALCMVDKVTGLTWQRPTVAQNSSYAGSANFVALANGGMGLCGKTNWRVPTVNELLSLIDMNKTSAPFNADTDAMAGEYWSSEQVTTAINDAWVVSAAQRGAVTYFNKTTDTANVRLVSGGAYSATDKFSNASACNDSARYKTVFNDGTVEDTKTGLMWKQCAEGAVGNQCNATAPTPFSSTTNILNRLDAVNADPALGLGYADWRIPTVKELASLVDRCTGTTLAINNSVFPNTQSVSYISASYNASDKLQFWYVDFSGGTVAFASPANKYLRLVRAGQ